jgi:salicylate biosynthesis isochorismate synthase
MSLDSPQSVSEVSPSSRTAGDRAPGEAPVDISRSLKISTISNAWDGLEAAVGHPSWAAWADGARDLAFVAAGSVRSLRATGAGRYRAVREACSALVERLLGDLDALPMLVGGFAFAPHGRIDGHGDAHLFLPQWLLVQRGDGPVLHITHRVAGSSEPMPTPAKVTARAALKAPLAWRSEPDETGYRACVAAATAAIARGEIEKVVLARRALVDRAERRIHPAASLRALRSETGGSIVFGFGFGDRVFLGATPETLAEVGEGRLRTHALAGTGEPEELRASDKDRREHDHVVRDITAALAPIAQAVRAAPAPHLVTAGRLTHLSTPIEADLDGHILDAVAALHPTAALSGVPRAEAAAFLAATERIDRGWYGAPVGFIAPNGDGLFAVAIRSALLGPHRAEAWAGAGIVAGSEPAREWAETERKLETVTSALRLEGDP